MIFSDSQALPRGENWGAVPYESTYPWVLRQLFLEHYGRSAPHVIERGMRYRTVEDVLREWHEEVELKRPEVVVLQVGGSDCAPRVLGRRQREWLDNFPIPSIGKKIRQVEFRYRRHLLSRLPGSVYVGEERFRKALNEVVTRADVAGVQHLLLLNICSISDKLEMLCPGLRRNAERYNAIIEEVAKRSPCKLVDFRALLDDWGGPDRLTVDSMHMRPDGHRRLAAFLHNEISQLTGPISEENKNHENPTL